MPDLPLLTAVFLVAAAATSLAGVALAQSGDAIAEKTGVGRLTVGMFLVAGATSLPEVATDVSAALAGAPDLAVGDLFGSSMANMAILALLELVYGGRVWRGIARAQLLLGGLALLLTGIALAALVYPLGLRVGWIGPETVLIVALYLVVVRMIQRRDPGSGGPARPVLAIERGAAEILPVLPHEDTLAEVSLRTAGIRFAVATGVILVSAPVLAISGAGIAEQTGLGQTFVGAAFLAVVTSLPELVASFAAVRLGAIDLAVGNLLGSNAFNMNILLATDAAYLDGPLLASVEPFQALAGGGAVGLMIVALVGLARPRAAGRHPLAALLLLAYLALLVLLAGRIG